ncbi:MAG: response regulator [Gammaproteobacteria bacterium]|nr:response regulator [Gammaproteobacteria bacterium]
MATPIIICDDSSFARKQIARALPAGWDVTITYATNGREGLAAIRAGRGDVLFLDLTMPDMDGFAVLEAIRAEDLQTLPIVVSGDIQPESQRRVKQLGAVAFIKKPVDGEELVAVLGDYGVLSILNGGGERVVERVEFSDWCQEIANVAMGRAAELLTRLIGQSVELSIPRVNLLEASELAMTLSSAHAGQGVSLVSQGFIGGGVSGETLLSFDDSDIPGLAALLRHGDETGAAREEEALMDVANVLVGAFLKGIADQLDIQFSQGHPRIQMHRARDKRLLPPQLADHRRTLAIELGYTIGSQRILCDQLVLFTETSIAGMQQRAQMAIGDEV